MTLVLIGPVCEDLIIIGDEKNSKVGGAIFFQSFVYEEFYEDYLVIANTSKTDLINDFPDKSKVKVILKEDTHYFINEYPNKDNLDIRNQTTNFADITILKDDLKLIFDELDLDSESIDAFVLNPLNKNDFSVETLDYLSSFNVPIYISLQGFLRFKGEDDSIVLRSSDDLDSILDLSEVIFMDEKEARFIKDNLSSDSGQKTRENSDSKFIITNGSKGSRITNFDDINIKINAVKCENIKDATGCGDTYMAAYISSLLNGKSLKESGEFASLIASKKLEILGPYKRQK